MMKLARIGLVLTAVAGFSLPTSLSADEASFVGAMNDEFTKNAIGTVAQTRSEVARCTSYWQLWAEQYDSSVPAEYRAAVTEGLGPEATAAAVAWHEALADETWDKSDFEMLERRVRDMRRAETSGRELLAKWKANPADASFFAWLGSCGTR